ncbi:MAG: cytidylate kinase-like family protein [candidate division Zixibacteria bacterium]|nr:cytidylate kinase-like family protein [candidate division Zixibacteria bacterium]
MSVIAISRGSLRATKMLAVGLSERLGNKIVSREEVYEAAAKYGILDTKLGGDEIIEQKTPGFWDRHSDKRRQYLACFKAALLDFAMEDSIIYHGHLAHILLTEIPFVLRVKLDAPLEKRIELLINEKNVSHEEAVQIINDIDMHRLNWAKFLYNVDSRDPLNYDIQVNLAKMNIQTGIEIVATAAAAKEFQPSDKTMKDLKDLHLAALLQILVISSPRTHGMELDISADSATGKVKVAGSVPIMGGHTWEADIKATLSEHEAVKEVEIMVDSK